MSRVCLEIPRGAWDTIDETITADRYSHAFDRGLRASIGRSWGKLRTRDSGSKVRVEAPMSAWNFIQETLDLDAKSSRVDSGLRRVIRKALDSVREVPCSTRKR